MNAGVVVSYIVSIRSPDRSQGRREGVCDRFPPGKVSIRSPDRSQGRPPAAGKARVALQVSIRSPDRSQGRLAQVQDHQRREVVSIRSPDRSQGRRMNGYHYTRVIQFQSAPLTGARGDPERPSKHVVPKSFNPLP